MAMDFERPDDFLFIGTVEVVWQKDATTTITIQGIYEGPDQQINLGYPVMGNDHSVTFETASLPGLANGMPLAVDGQSYVVRDVAALGDEVFSKATLKKV
jgi:hypothetical protein